MTICARCDHHFEHDGHRCRAHRRPEIPRKINPVTGDLGWVSYRDEDGFCTPYEYGQCGDYNTGNCPDFREWVPKPQRIPWRRRAWRWLCR